MVLCPPWALESLGRVDIRENLVLRVCGTA
jgi:hypothetical protein